MVVSRGDAPAQNGEIRIVAVAASLGGIEALCRLIRDLPADFPVPVVVVQHIAASASSLLDRVIQARSALRVKWAAEGDALESGTVYLAPPNRHLIVTASGTLSLYAGVRVNWVRPAADVLFDSVARHFGKQALAIVLTGSLFDGAAGSVRIKQAGGWVLAQDEESSRCFDMPRSAIRTGAVDFVLSLEGLSFAVLSLVMAFGATSLFRVPCRLSAALNSPLTSGN